MKALEKSQNIVTIDYCSFWYALLKMENIASVEHLSFKNAILWVAIILYLSKIHRNLFLTNLSIIIDNVRRGAIG